MPVLNVSNFDQVQTAQQSVSVVEQVPFKLESTSLLPILADNYYQHTGSSFVSFVLLESIKQKIPVAV